MDYTMAEQAANMTIYFSKSTGQLKGISSGINDMGVYGIDALDYALIWDFKVIPIDDYVSQNPDKFIVDISGTEPVLSLKQESVNQYPVAP